IESDDLRQIDAEVEALLETAIEEAEAAPYPNPEDVLTDVYVSE
ncbi:MAG: ABC transporter substrate-binding protein, partial [Myxococcota bacterium]